MALTTPITSGGFSFSGDTFSALASGGNIHRRATLPELRAHFDGSDTTDDRPAHWYEAQLIHYGLKVSKVKGTAKMRLLDAFRAAGGVRVPVEIQALETAMKKEWTAQHKKGAVDGGCLKQKEAKTTTARKPKASALAAGASVGGGSAGMKRKADDGATVSVTANGVNINLTFSVNGAGTKQPAAKKAKTDKANAKAKPATDSKQPRAKPAGPAAKKLEAKPAPETTKAKTARASATTITTATAATATTSAPDAPKPRTKQTARRSTPIAASGASRAAGSTANSGAGHGTALFDEERSHNGYGGYGGHGGHGGHGGYRGYDDDGDVDMPPPPYSGSSDDDNPWY